MTKAKAQHEKGNRSTALDVYLLSSTGVVPSHCVRQKKAAELASAVNCWTSRQSKVLGSIYHKVEIDHRYSVFDSTQSNGHLSFNDFFIPGNVDSVGPSTKRRMLLYEKYAPELAHMAAGKVLKKAGVSCRSIGHIISVSCTGFVSPGFDVALIKSLGIPRDVSRTHIGFMGCHGVFNALRVASAFAEKDPSRHVLICSVEICSLHFRSGWNLRHSVANALFSDGAAAAVISSRLRGKENMRLRKVGSYVFPDSEEAITWRIGDNGFEMKLSSNVPLLIRHHLKAWLDEWLAEEGLLIENIRSWAVHPGGPGILKVVEKALDLPPRALAESRNVLRNYGNMSSATILFILENLTHIKMDLPCLALGFGPGLTVEAALFL